MKISILINTDVTKPGKRLDVDRHFWLSPRGWRCSIKGGRWIVMASPKWMSSMGFLLHLPVKR